MKTGRVLIAAVLCLGAGLWVTFAYCNGTVGFNVAYPFSATKLTIDITTTGIPVLVGTPLVVIGLLLMLIAFIAAVVAQFRGPRPMEREEVSRREMPFEG